MRGPGQDGAREADQLALADREVLTALVQLGVVAVLQLHDEVVGADGLRGLDDLVVGRVEAAVEDVLLDGAGEQEGVLQHHARAPRQRAALDLLQVDGRRSGCGRA